MKRPEYVAVVTRIYAALLRENRKPAPEERRQLELAFSREGFTDGYWRGRLGPEMFGSRPEDAPDPADLFREARSAYEREDLRTVPVRLSADIRRGAPARLTVTDGEGRAAAVCGPVPEAARNRALEAEDVKARLTKTGGTAFRAEAAEVRLDPGLSLPASAVNALRRDGLEALAALRTAPPVRRELPPPPVPENVCAAAEPALTVTLFYPEQLTDGLLDLTPAVAYLPVERIREFSLEPYRRRDTEFCALLPRICKDGELPELLALLEEAKARGCESLCVQNLGQLALGEKMGLPLRGGFGLNVFNSRSLAQCRDWGLQSAALSFELRCEQIRDLRKALPCEAIVYGRLPLMLTENCLVSNALSCGAKNLRGPCRAGHTLTDRRGERFPILPAFGCRSELQNSKVLFLADRAEYRRCGLAYANLRFTTESPAECVRVLARYLGRNDDIPRDYTRGLFYRGVE